MIHIRPAEPEDSANAVEVVRAVFDEYGFTWDEADYHADLYDLRDFYLDKEFPFWMAENEAGLAVGTVALDVFPTIPGAHGELAVREGLMRIGGCDCGLMRLYVKPEARRTGVGSALLRTVLEEAHRRDFQAMEIWSDKRFVDAHRLYERLGARVVGDRICHDPDQSPEWGLMLSLRASAL